MNPCTCGCDKTAHHPPGEGVNTGCFHCGDCKEFSLDFDNLLPCAGTNRDDEPCTKDEPSERRSLGIYAGKFCNGHWKTTSYRKEGPSGFDPAYAGETYGDEDL
jgi:hypothetical protein